MQADHGIYPVLSLAASQAFEQAVLGTSLAATGHAIYTAGQKLAQAIQTDFTQYAPWPAAPRLLVLCGKGHNGADALQAAYHLALTHPQASIDVVTPFDPASHQPLTHKAWETLWAACSQRVSRVHWQLGQEAPVLPAQQRWDLCLDGLLGLGSSPTPLSGPLSSLIHQVNQHRHIGVRVAIDLPSGLVSSPESLQAQKSSLLAASELQDASNSACRAAIFRADFTYCLGTPKAPLLEPMHQPWLGRLRYLDLGFFDAAVAPQALGAAAASEPADHSLPSLGMLTASVLNPLYTLRNAYSDKRHYGHLLILAGSASMPGALALSTQAAVRSGVGKVTALYPRGYASSLAALAPEAMLQPQPDTLLKVLTQYTDLLQRCTAVLIGPGLGMHPDCLALVQGLVQAYPHTPLVLDADALQPGLLHILGARSHPHTPVYLTPHLGEARRLLGPSFAMQAASLAEWTQGLQATCQRHAVQLLLKGAPTYVCDSQRTWVSLHGSAVLAKGGSGDVLSGLLAGLVAHAPAGTPPLVPLAQAAVWHGLASTRLAAHQGQRCPVATDLVQALGPTLRCTYPF